MNFASCIYAKSLVSTPWKNGGGSTKQIAISPYDATLEKLNFQWRLSLAEIQGASDFSTFPGFQRLIALVRGKELILESEGASESLLPGESHAFSGSAKVRAKLPSGPVTDLGLIFDPRKVKAEFHTIALKKRTRSFALTSATGLFFVAEGELQASVYPGETEFILMPGDTVRLNPIEQERVLLLDPGKGRATLIGVELKSV